MNGTRLVGPSFLKLWNRDEKLADGSSAKVDDNYIHRSIIEPNAQIVEGFPPNMMPSFKGQVTDDDISDLIAFIKTIDGTNPEASGGAAAQGGAAPAAAAVDLTKLSPAERGKYYYENKLCITCHSLDGSPKVGPSFKGVIGRNEKMADGSSVTVDEGYIKESILNPNAKVVAGFAPAMPGGLLKEEEIADMYEFLKTVK